MTAQINFFSVFAETLSTMKLM